MKIEIYGTGCPKCHATIRNVQKAVKELGLEQDVEVVEVKDIKAISAKGIFLTPGVVIDGVKVSEGRVPSPEEIKNWTKDKEITARIVCGRDSSLLQSNSDGINNHMRR